MLSFELQPSTDAGRRFVEACEACAEVFAARAADVDDKGVFPVENVEELRDRGLLGAAVPADLGGWGVESIHDLAVGMSRLGRGDGSMAIAFNMHAGICWALSRSWTVFKLPVLREYLEAAAGGGVLAIAGTEAGASVGFPQTTAERAEDGQWHINGRKIFGTLSPAADRFVVVVQVVGPDGAPQTGSAFIDRTAPGVEVIENWDALGMRGSGSGEVAFEDVLVGEDRVIPAGPLGEWNTIDLTNFSSTNVTLLGSFLGIAEAARDDVVHMLQRRKKFPDTEVLAHRPALQHGVAEMEIALTSARAVLDRVGLVFDDYLSTHGPLEATTDDLHGLMKEFQCAKWVVNRRAIEVVDQAMTLSGGSGYMSASALSRLYRDVRAGPFMQPFSPNEAFEYIGKVALGLDPAQLRA